MKVRFLPILISLCFLTQLPAQNSTTHLIDSIQAVLTTDVKPRKRIALHLKMVSLYGYIHPDVDSLLSSAALIAEQRNFPFYKARILNYILNRRYFTNQVDSTFLKDIAIIEQIYKKKPNKFMPLWINQLKGIYYMSQNNLDKSEYYFNLGSQYDQEIFGGTHQSLYAYQGMLFQKQKKYKQAMEQYRISMDNAPSPNPYILNSIAKLHLEMENLDEAEIYADQAIQADQDNGSRSPRLESLLVKGEIRILQKDTSNAIKYFSEAHQLRSQAHFSKSYTTLDRLIDILITQGKWNSIESLLEDIEDHKGMDAYAHLLSQKGKMYLHHKHDANQALIFCKEGYQLSANTLNYAYSLSACSCLVEVNKSKNQYREAVTWLERKDFYQKQIDEESSIRELAKTIAKHEVESEMTQLTQDNILQKSRLSQQRMLLLGSIAAVTLLSFLVFRIVRQKSKIEDQNQIINKALLEKTTLLKEIHHRVKNNLQIISSLLKIQGKHTTDQVAIDALKKGRSRVQSMSLIHQNLYQKENIADVKMKVYLEKLIANLVDTMYLKAKLAWSLKFKIYHWM